VLTIALAGAAAAASSGDAGHSRAGTASWTRLYDSAQALYDAATEGNRQAAYRAGQQVAVLLKDASARNGGTVQGWSMVDGYAGSLLTKLKNGAPVGKWRPDAVRIKLSIDAAAASAFGTPQTALWLQYKPVITEDIGRVSMAMNRQSKEAFASGRAALDTLSEHADRIAGAAAMANRQSDIKALNDSIAYAARLLDAGQRGELAKRLSNQLLMPVEAAAAQLFDVKWSAGGDTSVMAPIGGGVPHRWIFGLSSFISSLLAYVSWRKYKASPYNVLAKPKPGMSRPIIMKRKI